MKDISQECVGWGAAAKSFKTKSEYCSNGKVKTGTFENECYSATGENFVCCQYPGSNFVGCTQDGCYLESEEGRKCYQFGREYSDGEVVDFIGYQCEEFGAAQSEMSVTENVCSYIVIINLSKVYIYLYTYICFPLRFWFTNLHFIFYIFLYRYLWNIRYESITTKTLSTQPQIISYHTRTYTLTHNTYAYNKNTYSNKHQLQTQLNK